MNQSREKTRSTAQKKARVQKRETRRETLSPDQRTDQNRKREVRRKESRERRGLPRNRKKSATHIDFFIDGEGHGRNPHLYTYLAAVSLDGTTYDIRNPNGLSSEEILLFLTDTLPNRARLWGYALGYDKTKWLKDLPRDSLFLLYHPEFRKSKDGKRMRPIAWNQFLLNMQATRFGVQRREKGRKRKHWEQRTVWDVFRYFQESFVKAIQRWNVCTDDELAFIKKMKDERDQFSPLTQNEVERYCRLECQIGARLVHALLKAHTDIGLETRVFYGPGSTAECLLVKHEVEKYMRPEPEWAHTAVMTAFSGGRFENRLFGVVDGPLYSYDISSAYPYQSYQLPCLQCGYWTFEEGTLEELLPKIQKATLALSHVYVPKHDSKLAYAPFPFRDERGSISYPFDCETWVWKKELLAAIESKLWSVKANEAILYHTACDHKPFEWVPEVYRARLALGKDGKGLVLKLAVNSLYGKTAQSVGKARFSSWVWAGNITSGCRAQILEAMGRAKNLDDILSIATDGIISRTRLDMPNPIHTDTGTEKPLGGWEEKEKPGGRVLVRPGLNSAWPPKNDDSDDTRARGVGRRTFTESIWNIVQSIERGATEYRIEGIQRFVGHKSSLHPNASARSLLPLLSTKPYLRILLKPDHFSQRAECGEWILDEQVVSFNPLPKRNAGAHNILSVRSMNGALSRPYKQLKQSPESEAYRIAQDVEEEQP